MKLTVVRETWVKGSHRSLQSYKYRKSWRGGNTTLQKHKEKRVSLREVAGGRQPGLRLRPDKELEGGGAGQPRGAGSRVAQAGRAAMPGGLMPLFFVLVPAAK